MSRETRCKATLHARQKIVQETTSETTLFASSFFPIRCRIIRLWVNLVPCFILAKITWQSKSFPTMIHSRELTAKENAAIVVAG